MDEQVIVRLAQGLEDLQPLGLPTRSQESQRKLLEITLHGNSISCLAGLVHLPNLTVLNLSSNRLASLPPELGDEWLPALRQLDLSTNCIRSLQHAPRMSKLETLALAFNSISSLQPLSEELVPRLAHLDLRANAVADVAELQALARLQRFETLQLRSADGRHANPVCSSADYTIEVFRQLPSLCQLDGLMKASRGAAVAAATAAPTTPKKTTAAAAAAAAASPSQPVERVHTATSPLPWGMDTACQTSPGHVVARCPAKEQLQTAITLPSPTPRFDKVAQRYRARRFGAGPLAQLLLFHLKRHTATSVAKAFYSWKMRAAAQRARDEGLKRASLLQLLALHAQRRAASSVVKAFVLWKQRTAVQAAVEKVVQEQTQQREQAISSLREQLADQQDSSRVQMNELAAQVEAVQRTVALLQKEAEQREQQIQTTARTHALRIALLRAERRMHQRCVQYFERWRAQTVWRRERDALTTKFEAEVERQRTLAASEAEAQASRFHQQMEAIETRFREQLEAKVGTIAELRQSHATLQEACDTLRAAVTALQRQAAEEESKRQAELKQKDEAIAALQDRLRQAEQEHESTLRRLHDEQEALEATTTANFKKLQSAFEAAVQQSAHDEAALGELRSRYNQQKQTLAELYTAVKTLREKLAEITRERDMLRQELQQCRSEMREEQRLIGEQRTQLQRFAQERQQMHERIAEQYNLLQQAESEMASLKQRLDSIHETNSEKDSAEQDRRQQQLQQLQQQVAELQTAIAVKDRIMEDKDRAISELKQKLQAAETAAEHESARRRELQRSLEEELDESRMLIAKLEDEIASRHAMESKLRSLLEADDEFDDEADGAAAVEPGRSVQISSMFLRLGNREPKR